MSAPVTPEGRIQEALLARARAMVLSPALPIYWENSVENIDDPQFVQVTHLPNTPSRLTIDSDGPHQLLGLLQLSLHTELGAGSTGGVELAGQIAAWFPPDLRLVYDGQLVRVRARPDVSQAFADKGRWMTPVTVEYEAFA